MHGVWRTKAGAGKIFVKLVGVGHDHRRKEGRQWERVSVRCWAKAMLPLQTTGGQRQGPSPTPLGPQLLYYPAEADHQGAMPHRPWQGGAQHSA